MRSKTCRQHRTKRLNPHFICAWVSGRKECETEFNDAFAKFVAYPFDPEQAATAYGYMDHKPNGEGEGLSTADLLYINMFQMYNNMLTQDPTGALYGQRSWSTGCLN